MFQPKQVLKSLGAVFVAFAAAGSAMAADSSADIAALQAVDQAFVKAFNSANADAAAALYDENAVLQPPNAPAQNGRAAIKSYLKNEMDGAKKGGVQFKLVGKPAGGVSGDMGWQSGAYNVTDKSGKVVEAGKYLSVSTKKNGKWLYVRDTWNADAAPAPAAPPAPATPAPAAPAAPPKK